ncbi:hypothetical protein RJT34_31122 [Clitoria ternatea]|uniref:EXPERA domain-containing protein n=1 Tax=Clitoria ternatea TaxID=43366 RepID=A0AAN9I4P8_CLITE
MMGCTARARSRGEGKTTKLIKAIGELRSSRGTCKLPRSLFSYKPIFSLWFFFLSSSPRREASKSVKMGLVLKLVDAILLLFFLLIAIVAPLIDAQMCLPLSYFPEILVQLKTWYTHEYDDYLVREKPHFFVGIVWLELLFQWPLSLLNLYAIFASKPWFNTTCLIYGVSVFTSMVAILSEMMGSKRASEKLLKMYFPFMVFGVLATLRGLLAHSSKTSSALKRSAMGRKKRA